ncbi:unnamed protein product [Arabidopsis halleri]
MLIGARDECDGVYLFRGAMVGQANLVTSLRKCELWHRRLGHPSLSTFSHLSRFVDVGSKDQFSLPCDKGWRVFDLDKKEYFVSRNIVFNEKIFPFTISPPVSVEPPFVAPVTPTTILAEDDYLVSSLPQTVLDERGSSMEDIEVIAESGVTDVGGSIDPALRLVDPVQNRAEPVAERPIDQVSGSIDPVGNTIPVVDRSIDPSS